MGLKEDFLATGIYDSTEYANGNFVSLQTHNAFLVYKAGFRAALEKAANACDKLCIALDHGDNEYRREAYADKCAAMIRAMIKDYQEDSPVPWDEFENWVERNRDIMRDMTKWELAELQAMMLTKFQRKPK